MTRLPARSCLLIATILLSQPSAIAQTSGTWTKTANGTFAWTGPNWTITAGSGMFPDGGGTATATLTPDLTGDQTINLNQAISLNSMTLGDSTTTGPGYNNFTIAAGTGGSLNFTSGATITSLNGINVITAGITFAGSATISHTGSTGYLKLSNLTSGAGTVTLNNTSVATAILDGSGTFVTNGCQVVNSQASASITSTSADDQFKHFMNNGTLTIAAGVNLSGTGTTLNLNGFTNQGFVTVSSEAKINVANLQAFGGTLTINPAPLTNNLSKTTLVTNLGSSTLGFINGKTFLGTVTTAVFPPSWPDASLRGLPTFVAGLDLHGSNAVVSTGLLVNNGYVVDSTNNYQGNATIIVDAGGLVKGAGYFQNTVMTQNGGKFQAGNSPGKATFGSLTIGPGGLNNIGWQINDAGPSSSFPSAPGVAGPSADANNQVSGWSMVSTQKVRPTDTGNLTWTATNTPGNQFNFSLQTLLGPKTTVGNDVQGAMSDFVSNSNYYWKVFSWTGTYAGPMTDDALTVTTLFDSSNFVNSTNSVFLPFKWHLDLANKEIDLVYAEPEPSTFVLTGLGLLAVWRYRRRAGRAVIASGPS